MVFAAIIALLSVVLLPETGETRIRVPVPPTVSRTAAARLTLDANAPGLVLILHGVAVGQGEGFTVSILAAPADGQGKPIVLAVTGLVGRSQESPVKPLMKMQLVVPL